MSTGRQEQLFLHPATIAISRYPVWITTILGSCVSVCMFDPVQKIGGINHYMIPYWNGDGLESPKYGNIAIMQLFRQMLDFGSKKEDIVCKIFGGAEMLAEQNSVFHIGQRNIEISYKMLIEMNLPVISSSTGGKQGRKILFNTETGVVLQKYLTRSNEK